MLKSKIQEKTSQFAGRNSLGSIYPITLSKDGQNHLRLDNNKHVQVIACGLACSEIVSGRNLADVLKPGFEYERSVLDQLSRGGAALPLSIHTSAGVPVALPSFIEELERHLPWNDDKGQANTTCDEDWCVSLQMEGASAVMAGVDMLLQLRFIHDTVVPKRAISEWKVAVGRQSYHGPPSTSLGARHPLFTAKQNQILYPVPTPFMNKDELENYLSEFSSWLKTHGDTVGCLLVEPQWGSSVAAYPWPPHLLHGVITLAHRYGVLILADEIMCGLGRHGLGCLFLSEAWGLDVDAVTFGKAVAAGAYPLSGAVLRRGARALGAAGRSVLQSHTYSGGNVRALLTATAVLQKLPSLYGSVASKGELLRRSMQGFARASEGLFIVHGQGLMWGALLNPNALAAREGCLDENEFIRRFRENCNSCGVLPYFVPVGGFTVTPLYDVSDEVLQQIGVKLEQAMERTMAQLGIFRLLVNFLGQVVSLCVSTSTPVASLRKRFRLKLSHGITQDGTILKEANGTGIYRTFADYNIQSTSTVKITVY